MRHDDLYVAGVGAFLPARVSVDDAIESGRYDVEEQMDSGQDMVAVAGPDHPTPVMAAAAGRSALQRSGLRPDEVELLLHVVTAHSGLTGWNAACYLQQEVLSGAGLSFEVRQLSNGAVASIELAAAYLAVPGRTAAMITSADQFAEPMWDRWRTNWGLVFADGASAAVLSRSEGFARVVSSVTVTDSSLEGLHRGRLPFSSSPVEEEVPVDFRARNLDFALSADLAETSRRMADGLRTAAFTATKEADVDLGDIEHVIVPGFGRELLRRECLEPLGIPVSRTTWQWSTQTGHMGAADQFAALAYLSESGQLRPGERVLIIGVGGGFNWSCVVLDIVAHPKWDC
ncbi:ketoacyl-ACP synthase III family protein [Nucisporomicrobium flavum]|jgi:3-oxoacyl-[acyl-carrier-protein] synthase III|uniref:ketoacyl-ACP synthase III family protein n=1 Tax=Nucisporomicrobium flavum TaxID=2785915 RepID=UPI0018F684AC|nr:ketoacyl-ACP synthase III family protein [Nucisporomicrobium flavum]